MGLHQCQNPTDSSAVRQVHNSPLSMNKKRTQNSANVKILCLYLLRLIHSPLVGSDAPRPDPHTDRSLVALCAAAEKNHVAVEAALAEVPLSRA